MPDLFGTDGVRGVANRELTPDLALALGRAAGMVLAPAGGGVVVGRDTRLSGPMLEAALLAGLCSSGVDAWMAGVLPTPAIAFLTTDMGAAGGAMISASHNPVGDNGIKFFSPQGVKVPEGMEGDIERVMTSPPSDLPVGADVGTAVAVEGSATRYLAHLLASLDGTLEGMRLVLDCAFGAAWEIAPQAFAEAGADVVAINAAPDGSRINVDCGSTSLGGLAEAVVAQGADLGLAFDGDADRVLAVDELGGTVDGDRIIALAAVRLHDSGKLANETVVATVMANLGFRRALEERGIEVVSAAVGDRYVVEHMARSGAVLGGEQSGHIIFAEHATTGDGVLTGLQVASTVASSGEPLSRLAHFYEPFPQVLISIEVGARDELEGAHALWEEVRRAEGALGHDGRVLLRASGTEPVVRVMVEAADGATAQKTAQELAEAVRRHLS